MRVSLAAFFLFAVIGTSGGQTLNNQALPAAPPGYPRHGHR